MRVPPRSVLAFISGVSLCAAITGASSALTTVPTGVCAAVGLLGALAAIVSLKSRRCSSARAAFQRYAVTALAGVLAGALLPTKPPPATGAVLTRALHGAATGDLFKLLDRIDVDPQAVLGSRVAVSGEWSPTRGDRMATVSRRVMTCCVADAVRVGFDVEPARVADYDEGTIVEVAGTIGARLRDGELRYAIVKAQVHRARSLDERFTH